VCWDRLLFSAKEALAKLWYAASGQWLGGHDVAIGPARMGTFSAHLAAPGPSGGGYMTGRWLARDGLIITAVTWAPATASADGAPAVRDA
jgi:4'-phosphopantetheinyl transferase EntD